MKKKLIRVTTVPASLAGLLKGQLKYMTECFDVIGISSTTDGLLNDISKLENIRTIPVEMTRKMTPFKDLVALYKLYRIFKKEQPFIVHTHTPKAGTLGMIASKLARVPNRIHTIAGLPLMESQGLKRKILNSVERITYTCATIIYPNSYGLKTFILENKFTTENKLKVIGNGSSNGIDTNYYNPDLYSKDTNTTLRKELNINPTDFVFIFMGRLVKDKGINELIDSFLKCSSQNANVKLLLLGVFEDHLDPLNPSTINHIETHKNIIHLDWQDDVRPFLALSNALVFPSYREGFPNVVLQAGAMELPCIVSNINGCNEIVSHNENGIIIPVKNTEKLHEAMNSFLLKPEKELNTMGQKSRDRIVKMYSQQFVWDALLKEYKNLKS